MKTCSICTETKSLTEFCRDKRKPSGRASRCKSCQRELSRQQRAANPTYLREWYLAHREEELAKQKAKREADPQTFREQRNERYRRNPEPQRARSRAYRKRHRAKYLAVIREWHEAHPERSRELNRKAESKRRARKLSLPYEDVDPQVVFERDGGICGICGEPVDPGDWHLDHVIPLAQAGHHTYANVQTTHPFCNLSKGGRGHERHGASK